MKKVKITKLFLIILIIFAVVFGMAISLVLFRAGSIMPLGRDGNVSISVSDYNALVDIYNRYSNVDELRQQISSEFYTEVDDSKLDEYTLKGLVAGLGDIYSDYYTKEEYESVLASLTGEYDGVGITMSQSDNAYIEVVGVTKGSPAESAGVQVGEYIVMVDDQAYSSSDMDMCAAAVRGKAGTKVTITFISGDETIERTLTRAHIVNHTVEYKTIDDETAYISIDSFEESTTDDFKAALKAVSSSSYLVLDLRDNPGGLVDSAIQIADMFMDKAVVVYTEDHNKKQQYYKTKDGTVWDKPFVVLVNENSASASEIFAAGIQDNGIADIIGTKTYGKGVIQSLESRKDGSAIKLTKWQYFTPSGNEIHKVGISPDYEVEGADEQLEKAIEIVKKK